MLNLFQHLTCMVNELHIGNLSMGCRNKFGMTDNYILKAISLGVNTDRTIFELFFMLTIHQFTTN